MKIKLLWCQEQLEQATEYIFTNNQSVTKSSKEILQSIKSTIQRLAKVNAKQILDEKCFDACADTWQTFSGTMGYTVLMSLEEQTDDEIILAVDILVDPALCKKITYMLEEFDSSILFS